MSTHNEPVSPAPFEPAAPSGSGPTPGAIEQQGAPQWVIPALLALLVLAAAVVFWLPSRVAAPPAETTRPVDDGVEPTATSKTAGSSATAEPESSPWSDAQTAKLRKEAQDVLAELLDLQFQLQERAVERWAEEAFTAAAASAADGDELYRKRDFVAAKTRYEQSRDAMQALLEQLPATMDAQLLSAAEAIEAGELERANGALELAALIEPENADLAELQRRADLLTEVLPLWAEAQSAEAEDDLARAEAALRKAVEVDPAHQRSATELQRVAAALLDQQFNDAMSDGYIALEDGRFKSARSAFNRAAKLQPGSREAASALAEVKTAETDYRLASLKRSGSKSEQSEDWQAAVKAYEQAISLDSSVLFAKEGLTRSRSRARLDQQFQSAIDEPDRLADPAVAKATGALLAQAGKISPATPKLSRQMAQLQALLEKANTPVEVTLKSDRETEVVVYKVARLGRFDQEQLTLRPGTYTAVGSRVGYRDVRRTFTISPDRAPTPVVIACTEPI